MEGLPEQGRGLRPRLHAIGDEHKRGDALALGVALKLTAHSSGAAGDLDLDPDRSNKEVDAIARREARLALWLKALRSESLGDALLQLVFVHVHKATRAEGRDDGAGTNHRRR